MISLNKRVAMLSLAGLMVFSQAPMAQYAQPVPTAKPAQVAPPGSSAAMSAGGDAHFVMAASAAGQTEIIASRLAQTHAQSAKTKSFAATMVRDHTAANDKLRTIAQKDGFTLAGATMVQQQADLAQLEQLQGADFDKAYATMMLKDHQDAVTLFTSESSSGANADLKSFAAQTLPTLQHHLAMAQSL
jgi:putative membrane protein